MSSERPYQLAPLVARLGLEPGESVARALGTSGATIARWATHGMSERTAERLAVEARLDPYLVWPEMLDVAIAEVERECAAEGCTNRFVPPLRVPGKKFCHRNCKNRTLQRERYHSDADYRERKKTASRRYYSETREWQVARVRHIREEARRRRQPAEGRAA